MESEENHSIDTVLLDVGGKDFKVSRSFIDQHVDTMLARLTSDRWNEDSGEPIFIDRCGEIFSHVLNYLRYGSIELPHCLPMSMFRRELDFYGIPFDDSCIMQKSSIDEMRTIKKRIEDAERHHDMLLVALYCYQEFMLGRTACTINEDNVKGLKGTLGGFLASTCLEILNEYLWRYYGLEAQTQFGPAGVISLNVRAVSFSCRNGGDKSSSATPDSGNINNNVPERSPIGW